MTNMENIGLFVMPVVEIWKINARNFDNNRTAFDMAFDENEAIRKQEELYAKGFDIVEITYAMEKDWAA